MYVSIYIAISNFLNCMHTCNIIILYLALYTQLLIH